MGRAGTSNVSGDGDKEKPNTGTVARRPRLGGKKALAELAGLVHKGDPISKAGDSLDSIVGGEVESESSFGSWIDYSERGLSDPQSRNSMVSASAELVCLFGSLAESDQQIKVDIVQLRRHTGLRLKHLRERLRTHYPNNVADDAFFGVCVFVDQVALRAPWGSGSWGGKLVRMEFFQDVDVNKRLTEVIARASTNADLAEHLLVLLSLGLTSEDVNYETSSHDLLAVASIGQNNESAHLSESWKGEASAYSNFRLIPLWVVVLGGISLSCLLFFGFRFQLASDSALILQSVSKIGFERIEAPGTFALAAPVDEQPPLLAELLEADIASGNLAVSGDLARETILINASNLFGVARPEPSVEYSALFRRIARALDERSGRTTVYGHTDAVPISSSRFQSNTALSLARAKHVANLLSENMITTDGLTRRVAYVGRGESEPLCVENISACHGKNRRVEIVFEAS